MKFEPISYEHAARLIAERPWDVSRSAESLASAHRKALEVYGSDACVVGLDLYNVEVEAYGCGIVEPEGNGVPTAGEPLFEEIDDLLSLRLDPSKDGRLPMVLEAAAALARTNPDVEIRVPLSGPFTIACHLLGMENMICELFSDPEPAEAALLHLAENQSIYADAARERGFPVSIFESSVTPPLLSPRLFSERVLPSLRKIIGKFGSPDATATQLIIGGDTAPIAGAMRSSGAGYVICPVETDQKEFLALVGPESGIHVRVNMNPAVFLPGNLEAARDEADRVLRIARGREKTSIGSLLPFDADPGIVQKVSRFIESERPAGPRT